MKHVYRVMLLIAGSTLLLGWVIKHSEPSLNIGLRYIQQAERIDQGEWRDSLARGIDHPLHPMLIVATHHLVGGEGPGSWQRAALVLCFTCVILLVIPVYLLTLELFNGQAAWLACMLVVGNPVVGFIVVNVLSESTFLLWWTFGLWASVRFLREGRFLWLPLATGFGGLAYLTRPEGMLLPLALAATLLILPLLRATQINWPRWWRALAFLVGGLVFLVGPYIALKGGLATKPPIARVLGLTPQAQPLALEREAPLPPSQTPIDTYRLAAIRVLEVSRDAVTLPLVPFALVGMIMAGRQPARVRAAFFLAIVLAASAVGLVRLYATAGYCSPQHAIVAAILMTMAAAAALTALLSRISIPGRWLGLPHDRLRPGPAVYAVLLALLLVPIIRWQGPFNPGPYSVYHTAGEWLAQNTLANDQVLDLTDWSLYFSRRTGYSFADVYDAPADPHTRWLVVRDGQIDGRRPYAPVVRELIGGRDPVARLPVAAAGDQLRIQIYDLRMTTTQTADTALSRDDETWRR
jgi:Dolichyl-phosphate-mannose-protein mannosyltransferase